MRPPRRTDWRPQKVARSGSFDRLGFQQFECRWSGAYGAPPDHGSFAGRARGEIAEFRGAYHEAYAIYCEAARSTPRSRPVRQALARVAPLAAQYWKNRGHEFQRRRQLDVAWKCYMQALTIRPNDAGALGHVRRVERDYPDQIAAARQAWVRYGDRALVLSQAELNVAQGAVAESPAKESHPPEEPLVQSPAAPDETRSAEGSAEEPSPEPPDRAIARADTSLERVAPPKEPIPPNTTKTQPESETSAFDQSADAARSAPESPAAESEPQPPASDSASGDFLTTRTASREDSRYRKTILFSDDIRVRVLDTDSDPDADVAVYLGRHQVRKIRNWRIGKSVRVTGQSGRIYEIVVLDIVHETETVKFGFRKAPMDDVH
jgi:hypothetical protein